jgi:hypothetical protein
MQAPRDFLLIGRVQKRNTRPMTVGEIMHRDRQSTLQKLDLEIRNLQQTGDYQGIVKE